MSSQCDYVIKIGGMPLIIKYTYHPEKGGLPAHYDLHRVELAGEERNLLPLLDELDVTSYIEAQLSLRELK